LSEILCDRALASLRRQTYERWEAVVVGDHCTDDTAERVASIGDPRIRFVNLPFRGPFPTHGRARWYVTGIRPYNVGLQRAKGQWIAMLDHDDQWEPFHLETLIGEAQRVRAEIVYARIRIIDAETGRESEMGRWPPELGEFGFLAALQHCGLRRFLYDENCRFADEPGDWNLARRLWEAGVRFWFVDRVIATHHYIRRFDDPTTEERMISELRGWAKELERARDWWRAKAEEHEAVSAAAQQEAAALRAEVARLRTRRWRLLDRRRGTSSAPDGGPP
jgi:glycosyltransferase involved in cell wall biosynthesis